MRSEGDIVQTWGKSASALHLKTYPDAFWEDAYTFLLEKLNRFSEAAMALAPERFGRESIVPYNDVDSDRRYDYILLHKGMINHLPSRLVLSLRSYGCIFTNDVFMVLTADGISAGKDLSRSLNDIINAYWRSMEKSFGNIGFIHIPKTAGTSVVNALRGSFPAVKYIGKREEMGDVSGYRSVCGHIFLSDLARLNTPFSTIFSVLRDPKERFLSAVAHCRRPGEDPSTLSPSMRAMREMSLKEYSLTHYFGRELCSTSIYLGWEPGLDVNEMGALRENAFRKLEAHRVALFNMNRLDDLARFMQKEYSVSWLNEKSNITPGSGRYFSVEEMAFIDSDLESRVEEERLFIRELEKSFCRL